MHWHCGLQRTAEVSTTMPQSASDAALARQSFVHLMKAHLAHFGGRKQPSMRHKRSLWRVSTLCLTNLRTIFVTQLATRESTTSRYENVWAPQRLESRLPRSRRVPEKSQPPPTALNLPYHCQEAPLLSSIFVRREGGWMAVEASLAIALRFLVVSGLLLFG